MLPVDKGGYMESMCVCVCGGGGGGICEYVEGKIRAGEC